MGGTASTSSVTVNFMMTIINVKDKKAEGRALGSGVSSQIYLCWGNLEAIRASLIFPMLTQSCWFYADVCRKLQMQKWQQAKLIFKANFLTSKKEKFYPEKSYNFWKSRSLEFRFHLKAPLRLRLVPSLDLHPFICINLILKPLLCRVEKPPLSDIRRRIIETYGLEKVERIFSLSHLFSSFFSVILDLEHHAFAVWKENTRPLNFDPTQVQRPNPTSMVGSPAYPRFLLALLYYTNKAPPHFDIIPPLLKFNLINLNLLTSCLPKFFPVSAELNIEFCLINASLNHLSKYIPAKVHILSFELTFQKGNSWKPFVALIQACTY
ncbi:hypothetical protein EGR_08233 [Echinococcus granulosus]|uniref:Uncharacterized protein n=1 Tax=Echinococcus granulosus TaxID=6210 RepID=W6UFL8_ECHGR|nr:hypothetical protein EGR_08233 [Echinococcus granulosus]EUB56927.1 hypothetical protein EGR_08233 [Echinococcus granulosus]